MSVLRYVDIGVELTAAQPPQEADVQLDEGERIVSVETVKDNFGYVWMRVWIARDSNQDTSQSERAIPSDASAERSETTPALTDAVSRLSRSDSNTGTEPRE